MQGAGFAGKPTQPSSEVLTQLIVPQITSSELTQISQLCALLHFFSLVLQNIYKCMSGDTGKILSQVMKRLTNLVVVLNIDKYAQCLLFLQTIAFVVRLADTQVRNHRPGDSDAHLKTKQLRLLRQIHNFRSMKRPSLHSGVTNQK